MNLRIVLSALFVIVLSTKCMAQNDKYEQFGEYMLSHCKAPKSVIEKCGWQFALVRLHTDKQGRVTACDLLNQGTDSMKVMFKPLLNYRFPLNLKMQGKTFVFAYVFYNLKKGCSSSDSPDPDLIFNTTYQLMIKQMAIEPKTIFYKTTFGTSNFDETVY